MKIGIITADSNGCFPVPASKGGAVSTLIESLVQENSKKGLVKMTIFSYYDEVAYKNSKKYSNVKFIWIKVPKYIKVLDELFYKISKNTTKSISYKSIFSLLYYIRNVTKFLKKNQFDKLILENNIPIAWIIKLSHYSGQYYYHLHNVPRINAKCKKVFDKCAGYLCVSKYVATQIESKNNAIGPIDLKKIKITYNAIDTDLFKPYSESHKKKIRQKIKDKYSISSNDKIILFTGRLSKEKGLDVLLDALKKINVKDYKLLIVGSIMHGANEKNEYVNLVKHKAQEISPHVLFTGYVAHNKLANYYNAADIAVLPSIWEEPAGLTMIEALSCGTKVITTNSGGIPEYVKPYADILNSGKNLKNELCYAIEKSLNSDDSVDKYTAYSYIKNNFSTHTYLERFVKQLE